MTKERYNAENTATPPPEIERLLGADVVSKMTWLAVPSLNPPEKRIGSKEIQQEGSVDACELLAPLLGNPILDGTLRTIDVFNGCGRQCDTCLADSAIPSRMFSFESLEKLFSGDDFIRMLQMDSLRFGSHGDIMDHPQYLDIVKMALDKTNQTNRARYIKVFTNYRPNDETKLDAMIALAQENSERMKLVVSLPFNRTDTVNDEFWDYAKNRRADVFGHYEAGGSGLVGYVRGSDMNIHIQDVRHAEVLHMIGRVLSKEANNGRVSEHKMERGGRAMEFRDRGLSKTHFNPDSLWLMSYTTAYESHTTRAFTPITPENISTLSRVSYHPDFPTPPNWPGGTGRQKTRLEIAEAYAAVDGMAKKRRTIVY